MALTDVPSVAIKTLSPQYGMPGTQIIVGGLGISATSVIRFGKPYRTQDTERFFWKFLLQHTRTHRYYDVAVQTDTNVSSTLASW